MRLDPGPSTLTADQVEAITQTRTEFTAHAEWERRDPQLLATAHAAYDRACRAAGVLPPPPIDQLQPPERLVKPPSRPPTR